MPARLDSLDIQILRQLADDGRKSWRDLADQIGLSLTPTLRRVRRLEAEGYIQGYAALLDEKKLTGALEVLISITLERQSEEALRSFETNISSVDEVRDCFQITGEFDYMLRVVVRDLDHYQRMIGQLSRIPMLARINSSFILKAVVRRPAVLPTTAEARVAATGGEEWRV